MSALKPLTVNEAIEKLTKLQSEGYGRRVLVFANHIDDDHHTLHGFEKAMVKFEGNFEPIHPKNRTQTFYGRRSIKPGRPKDHTPVVRIF